MSNLLRAIKVIVNQPIVEIGDYYAKMHKSTARNRANAVGDALEFYIKNVFADTLNEADEATRMHVFNKVFSYLGNQNNPPDIMIRGGDAIETKKIENASSALALNSSYPKAKLFADSHMITDKCKECEEWDIKDIVYVVGHVAKNSIKYLWMVYGDCFAADRAIYERIKQTITDGVNSIPNVEFAPTKELGRVNRVDPLGITNLRIRGMWQIENPHSIFDYLKCEDSKAKFQLIVLMRLEKFNNFNLEEKKYLLDLKLKNYSIKDVDIKDPDNPANLLKSKLITYHLY